MRSGTYGKREAKKKRRELPTLEELNFPNHRKLSRPKKGNRQALKRIARGDILWDHRKIERKGRQKTDRLRYSGVAHTAHLGVNDVPGSVVSAMLRHTPSWLFDRSDQCFKLIDGGSADQSQMEELHDAAEAISWDPIAFRVAGIDGEQIRLLRYCFHSGSDIRHLEPNVKPSDFELDLEARRRALGLI